MRIISRDKLIDFWGRHPDAKKPLQVWFHDINAVVWNGPADIKAIYRNASFVANNRVIFNIKGNRFRLVVLVQYANKTVFIRFVGTHAEYDRIDATTI